MDKSFDVNNDPLIIELRKIKKGFNDLINMRLIEKKSDYKNVFTSSESSFNDLLSMPIDVKIKIKDGVFVERQYYTIIPDIVIIVASVSKGNSLPMRKGKYYQYVLPIGSSIQDIVKKPTEFVGSDKIISLEPDQTHCIEAVACDCNLIIIASEKPLK